MYRPAAVSLPAARRLGAGLICVALAACSLPGSDRQASNERADAPVSGPTPAVSPQRPPVAPAVASPGTVSPGKPAAAARSAAVAVDLARAGPGMLSKEAVPGAPMRLPAPQPSMAWPAGEQDRERYQAFADNPVRQVAQAPVSTFGVDVDTGSYANVRRMLNAGQWPPADAVRVEEMINYFPYDYARPKDDVPFAVHTQVARAPWNRRHLLLRVAIKGQDEARDRLPPANLVFLVDVSGSMNSADKLPLLKSSLKLLVDRLRPQDRVSLVTYASGTSVVLDATPGSDKARIANAIDALRPSGSTAGASGIELAYRMARQGYVPGGINRILLATDGDFNVGVTDFRQLKGLVEERRKSGVSLSTLGFGTGNYNEALMEQLADAGDGAYSYIDSLMEGHKVLVDEMSSTLATIARDVKIQVEFNPAAIAEYRLIGYENRLLTREDFNNDQVDSGDIGAGHTVTALYELTPAGQPTSVDPLRYGAGTGSSAAGRSVPDGVPASVDRTGAGATELAYVKLRYKKPGDRASRLIERPVPAVKAAQAADVSGGNDDFRFAAAIAGFGQVLRGGRYTGGWTLADARQLAAGSLGNDRFGYRAEALRLMDLAAALGTRPAATGVFVR